MAGLVAAPVALSTGKEGGIMYRVTLLPLEQPTVITVGAPDVAYDLFAVVERLKLNHVKHVRVVPHSRADGSKASIIDQLLFELGFDCVGDDELPQGATLLYVGTDAAGKLVDASTTLEQVAVVKMLDCRLVQQGAPLTWDSLNNVDEPGTLFQQVQNDRIRRDARFVVVDLPTSIVVTVVDDAVIRLEFYRGDELLFDLRSTGLEGKSLPRSR